MLKVFLYFFIFGLVTGAVYDAFRFFRILFNNKAVSFVLDFFFCAAFSLSFFVLLLGFNNGSVRAIYFTITFFGFFLYVFTIMLIHCQKQRKTALLLRKSAKKSLKKLKKDLHFIWVMYYNIFVKLKAFTKSKFRKGKKLSKKNKAQRDFQNERAFSDFKTE